MQASKRVALNTGFLYLRMAITVFISLYSTRLILESLGAKDFGLFNVVGGAISMLVFLNTSMASATQRFMSFAQGTQDLEKLKRIFNISFVMHILVAAVLLIVFEVVGFFLFDGILNIVADRIFAAKVIYQFMIFSTLLTIMSVPYEAVITSHENMMLFAVLGILEASLKLIIAFYILHFNGDRLIIYGILMSLLSILVLVIRIVYCHKKYAECNLKIRSYHDKDLMKEMATFASWSFLGSSTSIIANYGQGIVMNIFFGTLVNAAQGIASQVSGQLGALSVTMLKALNPVIAKSEGAGNRDLMMKVSMTGSKISFFLLVLMYVPMFIEMPYIFGIWLKDIPPYTIIFCRLLLVRNLIEQLFLTLASSISAVGKIRQFQIVSAIITFFPLLITYALYKYGFEAYTLYVIYIVYSIASSINILYFSHKTFDLSISAFLKDVAFRSFMCFAIVTLLSSIPHYALVEGFLRLIFVGIVSFLSFVVTVWLIGFTKQERSHINQILLNMKGKVLPGKKKIVGILGL